MKQRIALFIIFFSSISNFCSASNSFESMPPGSCGDGSQFVPHDHIEEVAHYHLHKAGGITLNEILQKRYGKKQFHGGGVPSLASAMHDHRGVYFFSYVREPVAGLLSRFYFWRLSNKVHDKKFRKVLCQTLHEYMEKDASHNFMWKRLVAGLPMSTKCLPDARMSRKLKTSSRSHKWADISNINNKAPTWREVCPGGKSEEDLVAALEATFWSLRDRVFVGITEKFDESLWLFAESAGRLRFGMTNYSYCPKNVVVGGLHANDVPAATRDLMVQRNQLDIVLFKAISRVFDRRRQCAQITQEYVTRIQEEQAKVEKGKVLNRDIQESLSFVEFSSMLAQYQKSRKCTYEEMKSNTSIYLGSRTSLLPKERADPLWVIDDPKRHCK